MRTSLLRESRFRRFWIGQSVSLIGDQVALFAIPIAAVVVLQANSTEMGVLTAVGLVPSLLFSLHAGVLIDRYGRRRRTMITADLGRATLMTVVPLCYVLGLLGLPLLYLVAFALGSFDVAFALADASLFPMLVQRQSYVEAQALLSGSRAMSAVIGQTLAGLLIAALTAPIALTIDAASFIWSALTLTRIHAPEPQAGEGGERHQLGAGIHYLRGSPTVRAALAATTTVNYFAFAFTAIFILYATRSLDVRPALLGLVLGAGAIGGILGAALAGPVTDRLGLGRAFALGCVVFPAPLALVPLATGGRGEILVFLFLAQFWSGVGVMLLDISIGAIFAATIPHSLRARVAGAYRTVNYGIRPLGALTGGILGNAIGLRPTLWLAVTGATASAGWLIPSPLLRKTPRELRPQTDLSPRTSTPPQRAAEHTN
ncbi:MAG TPA: MFS transporter [Gaiellaceae bacterium]|jgi:MFS family permease|nr:MFS transporter [Gaiellaceae bacterium]